jgi:hypothetical protein
LEISPRAVSLQAEVRHNQHETIDAIANLATATAEDRKAVTNLTETNVTLTKDLVAANGKLSSTLALVITLTKQLAETRASNTSHNNRTPAGGYGRKHYCWTCGYGSEHSSWYCTTPAVGNQTRVKASDTMHGSNKNKP